MSGPQLVSMKRKWSHALNLEREANARAQAAVDAANGSAEQGASTSATTTIPTKTADGGRKVQRKGRVQSSIRPSLVKQQSSFEAVTTDIEWPPHFVKLEQTFRALNLVYTFCCTRKHFATTFDNIRSTVEAQTKRQLTVEDISQMKTLLPGSISFSYVDEEILQVHILGMSKSERGDDLDAWAASERQTAKESNEKKHEVLIFEFIDGDLKRQVTCPKTGEAVRPRQKLRHEKLKVPVYSQDQMTKMINKRNIKFKSSINAFLNKCHEKGVDAVEEIQEQYRNHIPVTSDSRPTTPGPGEEDKPVSLPSEVPVDRKTIDEIIKELRRIEWYQSQIVDNGHRIFDPLPPVFGELKFPLSQNLVNALYNAKGITKFFSHQAEAINNLYEGKHVIVSTSTSSGKSLIYQLPVLHELEKDINTRGMYIFPTKALAQDQRRSLKEVLSYMPGLEDIMVETFDGDTPMDNRNEIRDNARIIFTNPDMLHITILPKEESWRIFLQNLKFVVVDELHVYNGLFGSHMAYIMRRLRRICAAIGNRHVRFISCSATVANPEKHMKTIFGVNEVRLTDFDGSPSGRKEFLCWNSPYKDPDDPKNGRVGGIQETSRLLVQLILRGVRTIAFCRVRAQCELMITAVRNELVRINRTETMARVMGYRGGYSAQDRRRIEKDMFDGRLLGIVATTALELGVDIGSLDAVLICGFPYTIANLRQQSGRAGRRNKDSLTVLVGDCFPTDQHYMNNPDEIFTQPNSELQVDLTNTLVAEGHIQCAAFEIPINIKADREYFGDELEDLCDERLERDETPQGTLFHCNARFRPYPSKFVAIRDTEDDHFAVVDITHGRNVVLEEVEPSRAHFTIYEGGIFLHQGTTYLVKEFSPERRLAKVELVRVDWTTRQRDFTDIDPVETEMMRDIPDSPCKAYYGTIRVKATVYGFFKIDKRNRILDAVEVDNPPVIIFSKGMWMDVPASALQILTDRRLNIAAAIHAAEHAVLSLLPNYVISMPGDVRTECKFPEKEFLKKESSRKRPARLTFYDAKGGSGGSGISTKAFEFADLLLRQAAARVEQCECTEGCMECVNSELCHQLNVIMSKAGAKVILRSLLGWHIDIDKLPMGPEEVGSGGIPVMFETVILAEQVPGRATHVSTERPGSSSGTTQPLTSTTTATTETTATARQIPKSIEIKREEDADPNGEAAQKKRMIDGRIIPRIKVEEEEFGEDIDLDGVAAAESGAGTV